MSTDQLIERVKKLLALAGNNPNENEAALALEKASAIMAEHNLTLMEVTKDHENERVEEKTSSIRINQRWARYVWHATAELNFCYYFYTSSQVRPDIHNLIGTKANVVATQVMAQYLIETVERLAYEAPIPGTQRKAFMLGAATRLAQRMRELKRVRAKGSQPVGSSTNLPALANLYAVHEKDNEAFYAETHKTKLKKGGKVTTSSHSTFRMGMAAGENISLNSQVDRSKQNKIK